MLRIIARWWAKRKYIFSQETEAAMNDLHAGLAIKLASEKRALLEKLTKDADAIDANIKSMDEKLEEGFWECECGRENLVAPAVTQAEGSHIFCECGKSMKLFSRATMTGQEKYESDKERKEAEKIVADKRAQAAAEEENVANGEKTAKYFQGLAANAPTISERIRDL
jgi:hypothetical protein